MTDAVLPSLIIGTLSWGAWGDIQYVRLLPPVMVACGVCVLGFSVAGMGMARVRALASLRDGVRLLSSYVNRYGLLLEEALHAAACDCEGGAALLFTDVSTHLEEGVAEAFAAAFEEASGMRGDLRALTNRDKRPFAVFSARLTQGREECADAFDTLTAELSVLHAEAAAKQAKDGRMYRSLGILAALACGILMI